MYEEIIQSLMLSKIVSMILSFAFAIIGFAVFYVIFLRRNKKKKQSQKKKPNKKERTAAEKEKKDREESFLAALLVALLICLMGFSNLYEYLVLRKDMVTENYATYSGEFYYEETRSYRRGTSRHIYWKDENGEDYVITYDSTIDDYQPYAPLFEEFGEGNYRGTVVYSPRSGYLLWWSALPIED